MSYFSVLDNNIYNIIKSGKKDFVIYPFGEAGFIAKQILNIKYGIKEKLIIDNKVSEINSDVKNVEILKNINCSKYLFLISSISFGKEIEEKLIECGARNDNIFNIMIDYRQIRNRILYTQFLLMNVIKRVQPKEMLDIDGFIAKAGNISRNISTRYEFENEDIDNSIILDCLKESSNNLLPIHKSVYNFIFEKEININKKYDLVFFIDIFEDCPDNIKQEFLNNCIEKSKYILIIAKEVYVDKKYNYREEVLDYYADLNMTAKLIIT